MVKFNGISTTFNIKVVIIMNFFKKMFLSKINYDPLVEGLYAHQYSEINQDKIRQDYFEKWNLKPKPVTPETHPWMFDPCEPPEGWAYDPYYEIWINIE